MRHKPYMQRKQNRGVELRYEKLQRNRKVNRILVAEIQSSSYMDWQYKLHKNPCYHPILKTLPSSRTKQWDNNANHTFLGPLYGQQPNKLQNSFTMRSKWSMNHSKGSQSMQYSRILSASLSNNRDTIKCPRCVLRCHTCKNKQSRFPMSDFCHEGDDFLLVWRVSDPLLCSALKKTLFCLVFQMLPSLCHQLKSIRKLFSIQ